MRQIVERHQQQQDFQREVLKQQQLQQLRQLGLDQFNFDPAQVNAQLNYQAQLQQYLQALARQTNNGSSLNSSLGIMQNPQLAQAVAALQLAQAQASLLGNSQYEQM